MLWVACLQLSEIFKPSESCDFTDVFIVLKVIFEDLEEIVMPKCNEKRIHEKRSLIKSQKSKPFDLSILIKYPN